MSLKKLLVLSAAGIAAVASTSVLAGGPDNACPPGVPSIGSGAYIGVGISRDYSNIKNTYNDGSGSLTSKGLASSGVDGQVYLGYGQFFDQFYLALEANADWSSEEYQDNFNNDIIRGSTGGDSIKNNFRWGISLLPGYQLAPNVLLYGRLGYAWANFKFDGSSEDLSGFRLGGGFEVAIAQDWGLRLDYSHTWYGSQSYSSNQLRTGLTSAKFTPGSDQVVLGVDYHFAI